jgi:hypothetical protein
MSEGTERLVTVTTTPTKLFSTNPSRFSYVMQNQGATPMYIGNSDQVATSGTRTGRILLPNALESDNAYEDPKLVAGEQWGVVSAGSITVWVREENK